MKVEVAPNENVETLKVKVHFFKTFAQRKFELVNKESGKVIDDMRKPFKDCGIQDGTVLVLREVGKVIKQKSKEESD